MILLVVALVAGATREAVAFGGVLFEQPTGAPPTPAATPPAPPSGDTHGLALAEFMFIPDANATLSGRTSTVCPEPYDDASIAGRDVLDGIAIVTLRQGIDTGSCWTTDTYSDGAYEVAAGKLVFPSGVLNDGAATAVERRAHRFGAPLERATEWRASEHGLFFHPTMNVSYTVWSHDDAGVFTALAVVSQAEVEAAWAKNLAETLADGLQFYQTSAGHGGEKTLHGRSSMVCPEPFDDATISERDIFGDIAVVTLQANGVCWTSAGYSDANYRVRGGTLKNADDSIAIEASFRIDDPDVVADSFAASAMGVFFLPSSGNVSYTVWAHESDTGVISAMATVPVEDVEASWGKNVGMHPLPLSFTPYSTALLHGRSSQTCPEPYDDASISEADTIGDIAIVTLPYSGTCWTSAAYSHSDYNVTVGTLGHATQGWSRPMSFRIEEPEVRATAFQASKHGLFFRPSVLGSAQDFKVVAIGMQDDSWTVEELGHVSRADVDAAEGKSSGFVHSGVTVDQLHGKTALIADASWDIKSFLLDGAQRAGFVDSTVTVSDLSGRTAFILPSHIDVLGPLERYPGGFVNTGLVMDDVIGQGSILIAPSSEHLASID